MKSQPQRDAVAIVIGIEKYKRVAKADYANADAQDFYDYAIRALGIKPENVKLLVDDQADDAEIYRALQNWLPLKVKKGKTDVYLFFSGHGLPSLDGKALYLLPWGVDKDFVEKMKVTLMSQKNDLLIKAQQTSDIDVDGDETDEIQGNIIIALEKQLGSRDIAKINLINSALRRISENTYGVCEECEDDIPEKRLLANPYFMTCVLCAEAKEMDAKQRRRS